MMSSPPYILAIFFNKCHSERVKKLLSAFIVVFTFLLSFLSSAALNPSLAISAGGKCTITTKDIFGGCDSDLVCGSCTTKGCSSKCQKPKNVTLGGACVYWSGDTTGGCTQPNLTCNYGSCNEAGFCRGTCQVKVAKTWEMCTTKGSGDKQGECKTGDVCNTDANKSCDPTSGKCVGICFPATYTCNKTYDSRKSIPAHSCPYPFTCVETHDKEIRYNYCPDCTFLCAPTADYEVTCTCDHPGLAQAGKNTYTCRNSVESQQVACKSEYEACTNDATAFFSRSDLFDGKQVGGVRCNKVQPAEPPCVPPFDSEGRCKQVNTSFGNFSTDPGGFILRVFGILISVSGGIALILIMRAGYKIMTSRGNPEGIKEGREQIVAAIVGLMFLIFSFVFLQVIASDLLKIPGFILP